MNFYESYDPQASMDRAGARVGSADKGGIDEGDGFLAYTAASGRQMTAPDDESYDIDSV